MTEVLGVMTGGAAAAERAAKAQQERDKRSSTAFNTWSYFQLAAAEPGSVYGESKIVRIVTDEPDWHEAKQHSYIPTKSAPKDLPEGKKWMARFGAVCRYTLVSKRAANGDIVQSPWYDDCFICDEVYLPGKNGKPDYHPKASPRQWAWAVEREEVIGTPEMLAAGTIEEYEVGTPVGYRDVMVDHVNKDGETEQIQKWVVLNFAGENFFDKLLGYKNVYGTVVDRDYKITRKGAGTDTDYDIIALDPILEEVDGKQVRVDLRKGVFSDRYQPPVKLFDIIAKQAGDEHYQWFFDTRVETTWESRFGKKDDTNKSADKPAATTESASTEAASDESGDGPSEEERAAQLAAMREKLRNTKAKAGANA